MRPRLLCLALLAPVVACADDGSAAASAAQASDAASTTAASSSTGASESDTSSATAAGDVVEVQGDAFAFGPGTRVAGATVTILERPEQTATTDADGHFVFPALPAGAAATFVFNRAGYPTLYTRTFTLPADGALERVTFQAPDDATFAALAQLVEITPDPATCQIASTVTRVGKSLYDAGAHGEAGATVTITPSLPPEHGPIYFNADVVPQRDLVETSADGGILYTNVPPGDYVLTASKAGVDFEAVTLRCDADVLVNPSPPFGLQALP
ncbi:MAG: carboxypeptidase-like regulatory domain-containing protein [Nannocystaceae bacterium]